MITIKTEIKTDREWKDFISENYNLFFDPEFLEYNDEFKKSIVWHHIKFRYKEKNKIAALMTGCEVMNKGKKTFVSSNGVSFGGLLYGEKIGINDFTKIATSFKNYLIENEFSECILKNYPVLYNNSFNEEYEYAFLKSGFMISNYSITNIIKLSEFDFSKLANPLKRSIRNSSKQVSVNIIDFEKDKNYSDRYYQVLFDNRLTKKTTPTHSRDELFYLKKKLPHRIILFTAETDNDISGVCVLFVIKPDVILNFYLATDSKYKKYRVSDYLLYKTIQWAKEARFRLYDIGTSDSSGELIEGLFSFKKKFKADGYLRKTYSIKL